MLSNLWERVLPAKRTPRIIWDTMAPSSRAEPAPTVPRLTSMFALALCELGCLGDG